MTLIKTLSRAVSALGLASLLSAGAAQAEAEMAAFGIDDFSSSNACMPGKTSKDLSWSVAFAEVFYDVFNEWKGDGDWDQVSLKRDAVVDDEDWTDISKKSWGNDSHDNRGADHADVALISSHGSHHASSGTYYSSVKMGDGTNHTCSVRSDNHMLFGDDLEIVILAACRTGQYAVWNNGGYWDAQSSGFKTWLGFHGVSYDSRRDRNHLEDFAEASYSNGLGDNWMDEMHRNIIGSDNDQCPTAIIWAESESKADRQFDYGGFADRNKTGDPDHSYYYYISGCDPSSGNAID